MGMPAARVGDMHVCPMVTGIVPHVGGPVLPPCAVTVLTGGLPQARVGDLLVCVGPPDVIVTGAWNVLVCGQPAARMLDVTAHGGLIIIGLPTVLIGMEGGGGAPAPPAPGAAGAGASPPDPESLKLAKELVKKGGSATDKDVAVVVEQLAKLPPHMLKALKAKGIKVVACKGSVTDYRKDLKGVKPRGWPPGSSWDSVPGAYMKDSKEVVIGTRGTGDAVHVPATGDGHGSVNLVDHETTHGYDDATGGSGTADFKAARQNDVGSLGPYFTQPGQAGLEETYAESSARYHSGDPSMAKDQPALYDYWKSQPTK